MKRAVDLVRAFVQLPRKHQALLLEGAAQLVFAKVSLRIRPLGVVLADANTARARRANRPGRADIDRCAELVQAAARHLPVPTSCLSRSLALQIMLRRRGIDSTMRIGVRTGDSALEAHAWVEYEGTAVGESNEKVRAFSAFDRAARATR